MTMCGNGSFLPRVVSALSHFGLGRFGLDRFGPGSFRPSLVGRFGLFIRIVYMLVYTDESSGPNQLK